VGLCLPVWRSKQGHARVSRLLAGSLLFLTACASLPSSTRSAQDAFSATPIPDALYVDPNLRLGEISPYVFGTNYGPWSAVPLDLLPLAEQAGIRFLRFPGGNWGDENDMTEFQIDQFISLARQMGAEPSINVRVVDGSPEAAAEIVRYVNIEKGYSVRYWGIGNEPQFYKGYDTDRFNAEWRAIATAMQAVDANILFIGPEVTQYRGDPPLDPRDANNKLWVDEFLRSNGDLVDVVSVHRYPFPASLNSGPATIKELRANSAEWEQIVPALREIIRQTTGKELPIAVTEVNSHWNAVTGGEATPDSHFNAIWLADILGRMIRQRVDIVAQFALQSSSDNGGWGIFSRVEARPSYYVYRMYQQFGAQLVYSASGIPDVSIYSSVREDGKLSVLVINLTSKEAQVPFIWEGRASAESEYWLFDSTHQAEQQEHVTLTNGDRSTLPPESISLFIFTD
jgi:hypothetical protein